MAANTRTSKSNLKFTGPLSTLAERFRQMSGLGKAGDVESVSQKQQEQKSANASALSTRLWMGARLPFVAFVIILGAFTYLYHFLPILPWFLVFLAADFAVLVTWPSKEVGTKRRTFWDWGPMMSWTFAVCFAVGLGHVNYAVYEPFVNAKFLSQYSDVTFDTDPRAVSDAGVLNFATGTSIDIAASAGYKRWIQQYCAAPVVSTGDPASAPVGFWAVGTDCCNSRGEFTCDAAGEAGANSGMPVRPQNGDERIEGFNKAIKMSAAANNLEVAKEIVFVMWAKNPHSVGKAAWWAATSVFFALIFVGLCTCCACQQGFTHINVMEQSTFNF